MSDLPRLRQVGGRSRRKEADLGDGKVYDDYISPKPPSNKTFSTATSPRTLLNRDVRAEEEEDAFVAAISGTSMGLKGSPPKGMNPKHDLMQSYIHSLESHLEASARDMAAWKIRYYVELFRLLASRNHNKRIREQVNKQIREIQTLEQHALDLSKQNATLVQNSDATKHAEESAALSAEISSLTVQLNAAHDRMKSEKETLQSLLKGQKETFEADLKNYKESHARELGEARESHASELLELRKKYADEIDSHKSESTNELEYHKNSHAQEMEALRTHHDSVSKKLADEHSEKLRSIQEDAVLKENRVKAAKYDLNEKICQDLVVKVKGLELELQNSLVATAESTSHAEVMERQVSELEAELAESEDISRNRQLAIEDLTEKLEKASEERERLAEQIDPQFLELLKSQLEEARKTQSVTTQLNLESQLKLTKLEKDLADAHASAVQQQAAHDDRYAQLDEKYRVLDNKMRNGEFASDEYLAKLKEEMDRGVELQDQLLTSKRDVHILETELNSVRVNLKVALKESMAAKNDRDACEQELNTLKIENKAYKNQVAEMKISSAADRIAAEELRKVKEIIATESAQTLEEANTRLADSMAEANARVEATMRKGKEALEAANERHKEAIEAAHAGQMEAEEKVQKALIDLHKANARATKQQTLIEKLGRQLDKAHKRLSVMEGSDYESDTDEEYHEESSSDESDSDAEYNTNKQVQKEVRRAEKPGVRRRRLKAGRIAVEANTKELHRILRGFEQKMDQAITSSSRGNPLNTNVEGASMQILFQRACEEREQAELKAMLVAELEVRYETLHEEYAHSVTYCRFLEEELFSARKKELHHEATAHKSHGNRTAVVVHGNRAQTAAGGRTTAAPSVTKELVPGVSVVGGEVAGRSLATFLGATVRDTEDVNPFNNVNKIYMNHGGEIHLDGKQDIVPWYFNPLLSSQGEDQARRYELRAEVAMLRGELETQAFQLQCFLEDTVSTSLEKKMVARAAIEEWVTSFKKINDRNPLEADKIRSPRFTVLAEEYLAAQRKLEESLEEFHEPSYFAEQKRVAYEDACEEMAHLSGYRPSLYSFSFTIRPDLAWALPENPLAVTEKFPEWWFPVLKNEEDMNKFMKPDDEDSNEACVGSELRHPGLGVVTGPDEESLKRFSAYEETIDHLKTDVVQLLQEKEHYLTLIDHLQMSKGAGSSKKVKKKGKKKVAGSDLDSASVLSTDSGISVSTLGSVSVASLKGGTKKKKKKLSSKKRKPSQLSSRKGSKASILSESDKK